MKLKEINKVLTKQLGRRGGKQGWGVGLQKVEREGGGERGGSDKILTKLM